MAGKIEVYPHFLFVMFFVFFKDFQLVDCFLDSYGLVGTVGFLDGKVDGVPHCGRSYCSTMVVSRDADCLQHEFSSSREMVPTSSKVWEAQLA